MLQFLAHWTWWQKALLAALLSVPLMPAIPFFVKGFGMRPEALLCGWLLGTAFGFVVLSQTSSSMDTKDLFTPLYPFLGVLIVGMIFGSGANILFAQSSAGAPNSSLAFGIFNMAGVFGYLLVWLGGKYFPAYFEKADFSWINLSGIILTGIGVALCIYTPNK